jgi:CHAD domain-containing protein
MPLDAKRIGKSIRKLRKILKTMPKLPSPEDVHDLRTHTRRLEATVKAVGFKCKLNDRRIFRQLGRIRKKAGKVRDMDVLTSDLAELRLNGDKDDLVQLLEYLGAERYRHARQLHRAVRRRGAEIRRRLKQIESRLEGIQESGQQNGSTRQSAAGTTAAATVIELSRALNTPRVLKRANLHPYRKKVKELRYVLQMQQGDTTHESIDELGKCKDAIGEWHDWQELVQIAGELNQDDSNRDLLKELSAIQQKKFESALSITNRIRKKYVTSDSKPGRRSTHKPHLPRRMMKSATASAY